MNKKKLLALLMALVMTLTLVPVTALAEGDVAEVGGTKYATLQAAIDNAGNGETVTLLADVTGSFTINKSLTLTAAENAKITGSGTSAIAITAPNVTVNLNDLTIAKGATRGVCIDTNASGVVLNITGGSIAANSYALDTRPGADNAAVTINGTDLDGWAAMNIWGNSSTFAITGSELLGANTATQSGSNDFAVIALEADTTARTPGDALAGQYADGNTITLTNCTIGATTTANQQAIIVYNAYGEDNDKPSRPNAETYLATGYHAKNNTVCFDGCNVNTAGNLVYDGASVLAGQDGTTISAAYNNKFIVKTSGTYTSDPSAYLADGYKAVANGNGTWTVSAKDYVAQIGDNGQKYETLDAAVAAASAGDTVKLLQSITYGTDRVVPVWTKAVNLNLNGHTLTTNSGVGKDLSNMGYTAAAVCYSIPAASAGNVRISNGTIVTAYGAGVYADDPGLTLTLENVTINAGQTGVQSTAEYTSAVRITGGAHVIISSGSYTSAANALTVSNSGGDFTVNGGTFSGKVFSSYDNATAKIITINGGKFSDTFEKKTGTITINGGVFTDEAKTSAASVATLGEGKSWTNNSDSETSASYPHTVAQLVADVNGTKYTTLAAAIAAANGMSGDVTITVLENCEIPSTYTHYNPLKLTKAGAVLDLNGKTVTLNENMAFFIEADNAVVKHGSFAHGATSTQTGMTDYCRYGLVVNGCDGVTIEAITSDNGVAIGADPVTYSGATQPYNPGAAAATNVTIKNCSITGWGTSSSARFAVFAQNDSDVTIESGIYSAHSSNKSGVLYATKATDGGEGVIKVTGGKFVGSINNGGKVNNIVVSGGKFSATNLTTMVTIADGYEAVSITEAPYVYQVGKVKATELAPSQTTETSATFTAKKAVVDENNKTIGGTAQTTMTVTVTGNDAETTTVAKAALDNVKSAELQNIVSAAIEAAGSEITAETQSASIVIQVAKSAPDTSTQGKVSFEVHPEAVISVNNVKVGTVRLKNDQIKDTFTFKLNVSSIAQPGNTVRIDHIEGETVLSSNLYTVGNDNCVEISGITRFSTFVGEKVNSQNDYFEYLGASVRRRVQTSSPEIVVNSSTDMRFSFKVKNYNPVNKYYFRWKKGNGTWSSPVEVNKVVISADAEGYVASLVITNIPESFFNTNITAKIYTNGDDNALTGDAMSVMQVANAIIAKYETDTSQKQWVDYARYLTTQSGSYTVTYDTNHRVENYNYTV